MENDAQRVTWNIYTNSWSEIDAEKRATLLGQSVHPDYTYTDPNLHTSGYDRLSEYMAQFQKNVPGGKFVTSKFEKHHDRCLVHYDLVSHDGNVLTQGASYGMFGADGRLVQMVGFQ